MAHSFVMSFEREIDAFRAYVASFPNNAILLIDTYDVLSGAKNALQVAKEMAAHGQKLIGVRIDSGDLAAHARAVREIFDAADLREVKIIGSSGLDEFDLAEFSAANVPFDSYGVGTKMGMSADAPWTDISYKLVEYHDRPVLKRSTGKISWPGRKQVFRWRDGAGQFVRDVIGQRDEKLSGEALLKEFMQAGKLRGDSPSLIESRKVFAADFAALPVNVKAIRDPARYTVEFSGTLNALREDIFRKLENF